MYLNEEFAFLSYFYTTKTLLIVGPNKIFKKGTHKTPSQNNVHLNGTTQRKQSKDLSRKYDFLMKRQTLCERGDHFIRLCWANENKSNRRYCDTVVYCLKEFQRLEPFHYKCEGQSDQGSIAFVKVSVKTMYLVEVIE